MKRIIPDVFPPQPIAFLWAQAAVKQDRCHVAQQERVIRFDGFLAARRCANPLQRAFVFFQDAFASLLGSFQVCSLFSRTQNAFTSAFPWD